ncbi:hypothetical protein BaRGS_00031619 [Batillaria attramentaria]|uniref:Eukaryotic translation initiation factor 2A n=1 Tax=Batillaria attramentaria TaxID=370345 RepID=A0ABD0JRA8_9CAEN
MSAVCMMEYELNPGPKIRVQTSSRHHIDGVGAASCPHVIRMLCMIWKTAEKERDLEFQDAISADRRGSTVTARYLRCHLESHARRKLVSTIRGSEGVWIVNGPPGHDPTPKHTCDQSKTCRALSYSPDGRLFAWANADCVYIMDTSTFTVTQQLQQTRVSDMIFSPQGNVLATWGAYYTDRDGKGGQPNLILWDSATGAVRKALIQKKQIGWEPQWSADEGICGRNVNNELHFYENNDYESIKNKLHLQKVAGFSIAQGPAPYAISAYVAGSKGQPSYVRVYKYPDLGGQTAALANKSFYKADRVNMFWNITGTCLVILTSTESSDSSYYGEQGLHYITKKGPIYSVMWSPKNTEFCVVYGYMPSKATLFNLKCEPIFDFGTGPRNHCFYNPHGNNILLGQQKEITRFKASDTTSFSWSPDGEHILTATTSPRLRVGNGYKLWHYTGSLLANVPTTAEQELWGVQWQPAPPGVFPEKPVQYKVAEPGLASPENKKTEAYRPPQARGTNTPTTKLHEYEPASNLKQAQASAGIDVAGEEDGGAAASIKPMSLQTTQPPAAGATTGDPETDKKIRNLRKKLQAIEKLKEQQSAGKQLELNQLEKLKTEAALLKELEELEIG